MKRFFSLCMLIACLGIASLRASGNEAGSAILQPAALDFDKPKVGSKMSCEGMYDGTVTDLPENATLRANLGSVSLDPSSVNYLLTTDPISIGITVSARFHLTPSDFNKPAYALVHFVDAAKNDSLVSFSYTPRRLTVKSQTLDSLYPSKGYIIRVPLINNSADTIRVVGLGLDTNDTQFSLDASTSQNFLMQKNDTVWVIVHFNALMSRPYHNRLHVALGCDKRNEQLVDLNATVGRFEFVVKDIDFGLKEAKSIWTLDVMAENNGSLAATLQSLSLKSGIQSFRLLNVVSLPLRVAAGDRVKVAEVEYAPLVKGTWLDNFSYDLLEDSQGFITTPVVKAQSDVTAEVLELSEVSIRISPSPAAEQLNVQYLGWSQGTVHAALYDVHGNSVSEQTSLDGASLRFDLSAMQCGLYICKVECGSEQHVRSVFVVR